MLIRSFYELQSNDYRNPLSPPLPSQSLFSILKLPCQSEYNASYLQHPFSNPDVVQREHRHALYATSKIILTTAAAGIPYDCINFHEFWHLVMFKKVSQLFNTVFPEPIHKITNGL